MADDIDCKDHEKPSVNTKFWQDTTEYEQPKSLKRLANRFLEKHLNPFVLFVWLEIADRYRVRELFLLAEGLICQHFVKLSYTEQFLSISEERVRWLVQNERLVCSELCLLQALIRWCKGDKGREKRAREFLPAIKLEQIPADCLKAIIKKNNFPELKAFVDQQKTKTRILLNFAREKEKEKNLKYTNVSLTSYMWKAAEDTKDECKAEQNFAVKCWLPLTKNQMTQGFDFSSFHHCPHMRYRNGCLSVNNFAKPIIINNKLYVLHQGICHSCIEAAKDRSLCHKCFKSEKLNIFHFHLACYDLKDSSYKEKDILERERYRSKAIALVDVGFYVFVAEQTFDGYVVFHRYNTEDFCAQWETLTLSKNYFHRKPCVVPFGIHFFFVIGFHNMERYDIFSHKWVSLSPFPLGPPISSLNIVGYGEEIIAAVSEVDYFQTVDKLLRYLPSTDAWQDCKTQPQNRLKPEDIKTGAQSSCFFDSNFMVIFRRHPQHPFPSVYRVSKKSYR